MTIKLIRYNQTVDKYIQVIKLFIRNNFKSLLIIVIVIIVLSLTLTRTVKKSVNLSPFKKTATEQVIETTNLTGLYVTDFIPREFEVESWDRDFALVVFFSEPVDETSVKVEVSPNNTTKVIGFGNKVKYVYVVLPQCCIGDTIYTVTIKSATSISGSKLTTPYTRQFRVKKIEPPKIFNNQ